LNRRIDKEITLMSLLLSTAALFAVFLGALPSPGQAAQSKPAWELEWAEIVEAAKKDGQVTVYHTRGPFDEVFADFNKRYPGIKLVSVTGRGGELSSRIMVERRADKTSPTSIWARPVRPWTSFIPPRFSNRFYHC
jgi:ABC-type glycerol-3-phosphate transport system substrate-binding protein